MKVAKALMMGILIGLGICIALAIIVSPIIYTMHLTLNNNSPFWIMIPGFAWAIFIVFFGIGFSIYISGNNNKHREEKDHANRQ